MPKRKPEPSPREMLVAALVERTRIQLTCEDEDTPYEGNCSAIDHETDRKQEQWIRDQLASGNEWAWCTAHVRATFKGIHGDDYLGGCSYLSEDDFKQPGDYYDDMIREACGRIADQLIDAKAAIDELLGGKNLKCAGTATCESTVTHIDNKGWTYCKGHGAMRQIHTPCRKMTKDEIAALKRGETISYRKC